MFSFYEVQERQFVTLLWSKREYLHNSKSEINEHKDWKVMQDLQISYFQNRPMSYIRLEVITTFHFVPSDHWLSFIAVDIPFRKTSFYVMYGKTEIDGVNGRYLSEQGMNIWGKTKCS